LQKKFTLTKEKLATATVDSNKSRAENHELTQKIDSLNTEKDKLIKKAEKAKEAKKDAEHNCENLRTQISNLTTQLTLLQRQDSNS